MNSTSNFAIKDASARQLFTALNRYAREENRRFPYSNPRQFAVRLKQDFDTLKQAGLIVTKTRGRSRAAYYSIDFEPEGFSPFDDQESLEFVR